MHNFPIFLSVINQFNQFNRRLIDISKDSNMSHYVFLIHDSFSKHIVNFESKLFVYSTYQVKDMGMLMRSDHPEKFQIFHVSICVSRRWPTPAHFCSHDN